MRRTLTAPFHQPLTETVIVVSQPLIRSTQLNLWVVSLLIITGLQLLQVEDWEIKTRELRGWEWGQSTPERTRDWAIETLCQTGQQERELCLLIIAGRPLLPRGTVRETMHREGRQSLQDMEMGCTPHPVIRQTNSCLPPDVNHGYTKSLLLHFVMRFSPVIALQLQIRHSTLREVVLLPGSL